MSYTKSILTFPCLVCKKITENPLVCDDCQDGDFDGSIIGLPPPPPPLRKCQCGSDSVGGGKHSDWCQKK